MQADLAQVPVQRPAFQETTSLGAALAAGVACGLYGRSSIFKHAGVADATTFAPKMPSAEAQARHESWQHAVQKSFGLSDLR